MSDAPNRSLNHLRVDRFFEARDYRPANNPFPRRRIDRDRVAHGTELWAEWSPLVEEFRASEVATVAMEHVRERGLVIEIESAPGTTIDPSVLERQKYGLQLLNSHRERRVIPPAEADTAAESPSQLRHQIIERQVWFVPNGQIHEFDQLLRAYAGETEERAPRALVDCIERIGAVAFEQLWTDVISPPDPDVETWFEMWLRAPTETDRETILRQFRAEAARLGLRVGEAVLRLRDHTVVMVWGCRSQVMGSTALLACIAEIRAGRDFAEFVQELPVFEQADWGQNLLARLEPPDDSVAICVLDTGVNRHPLLGPLFAETDAHTIKESWGRGDDHGRGRFHQVGHGTPVAGIAAYADVATVVASRDRVTPPAVIESAKIVPPVPAAGEQQERHAAAFTEQGVALVDSFQLHRRRVYCLTSFWEGLNDGRPSAWSAVLDRLAAGEDREDGSRRLWVVAGGNVPQSRWLEYPRSNYEVACQIPAQAWNALVVGAFTAKREPSTSATAGHELAPVGGLAPSSATTLAWAETRWPYRPDVVMEGGNANLPPGMDGPDMPPELVPMTLAAGFREGWFTPFHATSAAAPAAAHLAARLMRGYPDYWPETIRALIVHAARWTTTMREYVPPELQGRAACKHLLRTVGYGVPRPELALGSAPHRTTLVAQGELQPFRIDGGVVRPHQMHVYTLPWPQSGLRELAERIFFEADTVRLRVTLSYFIEPNPGERGYGSAYRYASAQLRFRVNQPGQTQAQLLDTIHEEVTTEAESETGNDREESETATINPSRRWELGVNGRTRGSLHSDCWEGPASELIEMRHLVIYPVTGWWRSRPSAGAGDSRMRYGLVVTLEANDQEIDLYTEIAAQIDVPIPAT